MDELFAISVTLSAEDVKEDGNNDVVGPVGWVLDDGVGEEEDNSDVFEAVAGQKEGDSCGFNSVSNSGLNFIVQLAFFVDGFNFLDEGHELGFGFSILGIL